MLYAHSSIIPLQPTPWFLWGKPLNTGFTGMTKRHEEKRQAPKGKDVTAGWGPTRTMLGPKTKS